MTMISKIKEQDINPDILNALDPNQQLLTLIKSQLSEVVITIVILANVHFLVQFFLNTSVRGFLFSCFDVSLLLTAVIHLSQMGKQK